MASVATSPLAGVDVVQGELPGSPPNGRNVVHVPVDVRLYYRAYRLLQHVQSFLSMMFAGVSLGGLSERRRYAIDRVYYDRERMYHTAHYNEQGLWEWEQKALAKYFVGCARVLVACAGGGREVIALRRTGVDADGFECHEELAAFANTLLERLGFTPAVQIAARDACPDFGTSYSGVVVGWGGYMLIRGRRRRVEFLRGLRRRMDPGAPILLSFVTRVRGARRFVAAASIANVLRYLLGGERVEVGDVLVPNFVHFFTRDEIERELNDAGFDLAFFSQTPYGHAVGYALVPGDPT